MAVYYSQQPQELNTQVNFGWISEAFQQFLSQAGNWICAIFIYVVISIVVSLGCELLFGVFSVLMSHPAALRLDPFYIYKQPGYWATAGVSTCVSLFLTARVFKMANAQIRGLPISLAMLFQGGPVFLPLLGFQIVLSLAAMISLCCLIVPAFVCYALLSPAYALIADGVPVGDAITRSVNAMKQDWLRAGLFFLTMFLVSIPAIILTCGFGSFVIYPMFVLILSIIYRDMIGMPNVSSSDMPAYSAGAGVWPPPPGSGQPPANPYSGNQAQSGYANQWPPAAPKSEPSGDRGTEQPGVDQSSDSDGNAET